MNQSSLDEAYRLAMNDAYRASVAASLNYSNLHREFLEARFKATGIKTIPNTNDPRGKRVRLVK